MIYSIFPTKDSTIYEDEKLQNTGLDAILEITKSIVDNDPLNSRILIKFDTTDIPSAATSSAKYYLNLFATEATELPLEYTLYVKAISGSWNMGVGKRSNFPIVDDGASWAYRDNNVTTSSWFESTDESASYNYSTYEGGGSWYTNSICSQSYDYKTLDLRANVTTIVNDWVSSSLYGNEGFIVKRTGSLESNSTSYGSIKFYSKETHTIFIPKLEVCWDDSSFDTGSLSALIDSDTEISDIVVYPKNLKREYNENAKTKIRLTGRARFPTRTYVTSSFYSTVEYLPSASYYSIRDIASEEIIVPFDNYTKISCDSTGNYFNFWCHGLQSNRFYKFVFKVTDTDENKMFFDDNYIFKIVK